MAIELDQIVNSFFGKLRVKLNGLSNLVQATGNTATGNTETEFSNPLISRRQFLGLTATTALAIAGCGSISMSIPEFPLLGYNLEKVDHEFYRSAQVDKKFLRELKRKINLGSVFILRGYNPDHGWYRKEISACDNLGIPYYVFGLSDDMPSAASTYINLLKRFEETKGTVKLAHCQSGSNRSAFVSALYVLYKGLDLDDAEKQLNIFRGFSKPNGYIPKLLNQLWQYVRIMENTDLRATRADAMGSYFKSAEFQALLLKHNPDAKLMATK